GLIRSRSVARDVIASLRLDRNPEFEVDVSARAGPGLSAEEAAEAERIDLFLEMLDVSPVRNSRLVDVLFSSHDRVLSARAANRVAETYIAFNSEAQYNTSMRATASLTHQIANLQEEIDAREKELQEYAREHGIIPLSEKQSITLKNLNDLSNTYTAAQAVRIEKEARYAALRDADAGSISEVLGNKLIQELTQKSAELARYQAQLSEKYKPEWPEMGRLQREMQETQERLEAERRALYEQVLGAAGSDYQAARKEEEYLRAALEDLKRESQQLGLKEIQYNNLKAEISNRRLTLEALVKRQSETASSVGINELASSNVRIVDPAEVPNRASSPKILLNLILSLISGLALGVGMAFFLEYIDKSVKNLEEMQEASGVPALGFIPALWQEGAKLKLVRTSGSRGSRFQVVRTRGQETSGGVRLELIAHEDFRSKISEAFRELRTALLVSRPGGPPRTILITSTLPGEGKTAVALNLAITLAQIGKRVLLVDSDLRKPRLRKLLGVAAGSGLSTDLSGSGPLRAQPCPTPVPGLSLVPSGPMPPNPADLLDSERFTQILRAYEALGFDHIIFDSPPLLAVADPAILAMRVQTVVMVVQAGLTNRDGLAQAMKRLQQVKARVVGAVLNRFDFDQQGYYYYGYRDRRYYGEAEGKTEIEAADRAEEFRRDPRTASTA
ncbi:MAG: polysaccharide biosynthesis tyrosine autokinase, partial [Acidobacteriota bacterium]